MRIPALILVAFFGIAAAAHAQSTPPAAREAQFITIGDNALLSSGLIGVDVRNGAGELLGKIEDIVFEGGQLTGIVLEVRHDNATRYVAIDPSSISVKFIENDDAWRATVNARFEQLTSAPEFQYRGRWKR